MPTVVSTCSYTLLNWPEILFLLKSRNTSSNSASLIKRTEESCEERFVLPAAATGFACGAALGGRAELLAAAAAG